MRPKGWKNPYSANTEDKSRDDELMHKYCTTHTLTNVIEAYEAGADAMLGGLKRDYIARVDLTKAESTTNGFYGNLIGKKGYLVFIEE